MIYTERLFIALEKVNLRLLPASRERQRTHFAINPAKEHVHFKIVVHNSLPQEDISNIC